MCCSLYYLFSLWYQTRTHRHTVALNLIAALDTTAESVVHSLPLLSLSLHTHSFISKTLHRLRRALQICLLQAMYIVQLYECVQIVSLIISFISKTGGRWSNEISCCSNFPMKLFKAVHLFELWLVFGCAYIQARSLERLGERDTARTTLLQHDIAWEAFVAFYNFTSLQQ